MAGEKIVQQALKAVRELNPLGLFSRATEEAAKIPQAKGTPTQMRAALLKQGVKPDELKWTGFDDWVKDKQSVTRDEVADFLRRNQVRVEESVLGDNPRAAVLEARKNEINREIDKIAEAEIAAGRIPADNPRFQALESEFYDITDRQMPLARHSKFDDYTLPGGENYREVLIKYVEPPQARTERAKSYVNPNTWANMTESQREEFLAASDKGLYRSSHWRDDPDVLAHLRFKNRTDPEGRRILHLEEIQSDWGQAARKEGIKDTSPEAVERLRNARAASAENARAIEDKFKELIASGVRYDQAESHPELLALQQKASELQNAVIRADRATREGVSPAPFVESTPKWTDLALKRALREAVEGNYDALAWTPGAQQAKRFDLSQQVSRVAYDPDKRRLWAYDPDGENVIDQTGVTPDKVSDYIGREAAERLLARPRAPYTNASGTPVPGSHFLEGQDLSVGGEGMIGYYDKIVPTQLQKLVRPMDPEARIGSVEISNPARPSTSGPEIDNLYRELAGEEPPAMVGGMNERLPSLNITPAMREKIKEGLPLFTMVPGAVGLGMAQQGAKEPREGFAEGGEVRDGYDKGGVVKKALKAVADLFGTPEMEKWRGKSVIPSSRVEDRYFTGTSKDKDFANFNVGRHGVWLTKDPAEASMYALQNDSMGYRYGPSGIEKTNTASRVIPVFARAENPYTGELPDFALKQNYKRAQSEWFDQLRSQGHDAWLPENNPNLAVILRDPEQIKSAISNTGEFSGPRIDRAEGGEVRDGYDKGGSIARRAVDAARRIMGYTDPPTKKIEDWKWRPLSEVDKELGLREIPPHVQQFGDYMRDMSDKAAGEGLSARDLIKGFTTTRASIQRQAVDADKLRALGLDLPSDVTRVRPEGAWAEWLMTPMGQRYLDAASKGTVEGDAVANAIKIMSPFGRHETDIPDAMRWAAENLPGREARASDLVARAAEGGSSPAEWRQFTSDIRGVGPSKSGFLASLYGRGDQPTLDARQIILNTGAPTKEAAKYISRGRGEGGVEAVERLSGRQSALGLEAPSKYDPFYQHLAHHAIWDKSSNETTTHADVVNAMRNAGIVLGIPAAGAATMPEDQPVERASGGRLLEDEYPTHYLPNVGRQVMADGGTPDDDIRRYEARMAEIAKQPEDIRSMTHAPSRPMRPIQIEGGLIGKRTLGEAPYDVAGPLSGMAQAAYSLKTLPFYFTPAAPFAAAADFGEAAIDTAKAAREGDYLGAGITGALGVAMPGYAYRKPIGDVVGRALNAIRGNPGAVGAGAAGAAMVAPEDAEAAKARIMQQAIASARAIARAKELGYDTSKVWYHSALTPIEKFEPHGKFMGRSGVAGIHLTDNPEMANRFLERYGNYDYMGRPFEKNVMPFFVKTANVLERDNPFTGSISMGQPVPDDYRNPLLRMGYDALLRNEAINRRGAVKHVSPGTRGSIEGKELILTDPSQVRSIYDEYAAGGSVSDRAVELAKELGSSPREPVTS